MSNVFSISLLFFFFLLLCINGLVSFISSLFSETSTQTCAAGKTNST